MTCPDCDGKGTWWRPACKVDGIKYPEMMVDCWRCDGEGELCDRCGKPMSEQVSDERIAEIRRWANDAERPTVSYAIWKSFADKYARDIAALCRAELTRREAERLEAIAKRVPSVEDLKLIARETERSETHVDE